MPLAIGDILNNRYRIEKQIGQGGYGAVYRAFDLTLQQPCALKENLNTLPEAQRQFEREALLLARLRHPNLPRVIDHFVLPDQGQYLVMDFVEGHSLHHLLRFQQEPLPEAEALSWIDQVCQALAYLHQQQPPIIHRDIKPQNIIITPAGRAMLVDFGLSKLYDEQLQTSVGARGLTSGYAPPEQYGQGRTDARSDVYALGATLYTLLTKQRPPDAIHRLVNDEPLLPPRQLCPHLSLHVEQAVLKAMELSTSKRFETIETFRRALNSPATRPSVRVIPPLDPSKPISLPRPNKALLGSLASIGLIAMIGFGYWTWQAELPANRPEPTPTQTAAVVAKLSTLGPLPTPTPSPVPPTDTLTPTHTPTQTPTSTLIPPTDTPVPPADTPIPPTDTPTPSLPPTPDYEFELVEVTEENSAEGAHFQTFFKGIISDAGGNPLDGVFVQATCSNYSTISYPSGPVPWGIEKGNTWSPGYYDINLGQPQPCAWQLTIVDTDDRKTVKATLSQPATIEVNGNEQSITVNWRKKR